MADRPLQVACYICDNTLENCFIQISSYSHAHVHKLYEKTKGQIPSRPSSGKQNIQDKEVYWRDCGTDYGDLDNNSSNSAYKHSLQLSMANCLLSNKLAQYIWTCHCDKFAISTLQTNETEIIRRLLMTTLIYLQGWISLLISNVTPLF